MGAHVANADSIPAGLSHERVGWVPDVKLDQIRERVAGEVTRSVDACEHDLLPDPGAASAGADPDHESALWFRRIGG